MEVSQGLSSRRRSLPIFHLSLNRVEEFSVADIRQEVDELRLLQLLLLVVRKELDECFDVLHVAVA